jgi:hypothetical protein
MATLPKVLISRADYQIGGGVALGLRTQGPFILGLCVSARVASVISALSNPSESEAARTHDPARRTPIPVPVLSSVLQ